MNGKFRGRRIETPKLIFLYKCENKTFLFSDCSDGLEEGAADGGRSKGHVHGPQSVQVRAPPGGEAGKCSHHKGGRTWPRPRQTRLYRRTGTISFHDLEYKGPKNPDPPPFN